MNEDHFVWDVYVKGKLIGTTSTNARMTLLKEHFGMEDLSKLDMTQVEFKLVGTGE